MNNVIKKTVSVASLKQGDTVLIDGVLRTVSSKDIRRNGFTGDTFQGSPFRKGITKVTFVVKTSSGFRYQ